jgi:hypothetical protein
VKTLLSRFLLLCASTALFFAAAEFLYRALAAEEVTARNLHLKYALYFQDEERLDRFNDLAEAEKRGIVIAEPTAPRTRQGFAPGRTFYLCYTGIRQPYFDDQGCVPCTINSRGIRDREELCEPKPPGQRRIVCLGDSFTFGWGVRVEDAWPRLVERALRERDDGIRTVNCGAAGSIYVDEYQAALEHRFFRFEPDAVVVTLCLNDLLPSSNALAHQEPLPWALRKSRILRDLFQGYALQASLHIDPERDLVQQLLDLPAEYYPAIAPWASKEGGGPGREAMWAGGGPQASLRAMSDWCAERRIPFAVVLWPYFQGLGPREHYPFEKMHRLVGAFCREHEIPFLDLLPTFRGQDTPSLWVSPADYHGNHIAHELATPPITAFVADLLGLGR